MSTVRSGTGTAAAQHRTHPLSVLAALAYLALALGLGGAVVLAAPPSIHGAAPALAGVFAVAAYAIERTSRRAADLFSRNVAPALYVLAVLLLPAPWAVLIAAVAVVACHLTRNVACTGIRVLHTAHTIAMVALFSVLVHVIAGCAGHTVAGASGHAYTPQAPLPWLEHAMRLPPRALLAGVSGGAGGGALAGLALAAYLLDTAPLAVVGALVRRANPLRVWHEFYWRTLFADLAVPSMGILVAVEYSLAQPALALTLAPLLCAGWALEQGRVRRAATTRSGGRGGAVAADEAAMAGNSSVHARLNAVLAVVRAVGGQSELAEVTRTLAQAATQLTPFRSCTVYLYESHDGLFRPHAGSEGARALHGNGAPIARQTAEAMMSLHNRLGYSYYTPIGREPGAARERWRAGDALLVPLLLSNGDVIGFMALDAPADGRVPQPEDLAPLESVAALGAGVIARLRHADEVLHLATSDPLTGLLNRRAFEARLHGELEAHAYRRPVALMMIDLDDFGSINNTYGHQAGDEALRLVSGVIRRHLRQNDAGGRYGGDEFVVILPGLDEQGALDVAERVRAALVEATARAAAEGRLPQLHTSIGVAVYPGHAPDVDSLIRAADEALYSSKRRGKNCVSLHAA